MRVKINLLIPILLIFSIFISKVLGCTVATHEFKPYGVFSARSLDVCIDIESQFTVYPRGVKFSGAMSDEIKNTVSWQNKYGFVIIEESNVHNLGTEGLNEKGLGVHLLYIVNPKKLN